MNINVRNTPLPPDDTTMIVFRGKKGVDPERKRDMARNCGVECIKLRYKEYLTSPVGTSGFQPVYIATQPKFGGGTQYVARWNVNEWTKEPLAERAMDFIPDEMNIGWAYLPDSPFNRVHLAYAEIAKNAPWEIHDKEILKQIQELGAEIQKSVEFRQEQDELDRAMTEVKVRVQERGVTSGEEQKTRIEITNNVLAAKIKELEQEKLRKKNLERIAELQAEMGIKAAPKQTQAVEVKPDDVPVIDQKEVRNRAKSEVYSENAELVDSIKAAHLEATGKKKGWGWSKDYRDKIEPLIELRIKEITEREYSTTGGAS